MPSLRRDRWEQHVLQRRGELGIGLDFQLPFAIDVVKEVLDGQRAIRLWKRLKETLE